jgi:polysaccharide export outer membrane protein
MSVGVWRTADGDPRLMTVPAERRLVALAVALVVWAAWSPSSRADVVELMTGEKVEGTVKGTTPRGLVIEVRGRERTIAHRLVRGIVFGPARRATPSPDRTQPSAAIAAPAAALPALPTQTSTVARAEPAAAAPPTPAPTRAEPPSAVAGASPTEPTAAPKPAPEPAAGGEPAGPGPAPPQTAMPVEAPPALPSAAPAPPPPPTPSAEEPPPGEAARPGDYKIGPEDLLDIAVWNNTAMSRAVPVRPDGKISLPLVNDVQAAGLTPMQLREVLVEKLTAYIPRPEVSVIVREVHSFKVSVIGEVRKAGQYELKSRATVLDLIALAGGLTPFASPSRIVILRQEGTTTTRIPFNYKKATSSTPLPDDVVLQPGDVIVVP